MFFVVNLILFLTNSDLSGIWYSFSYHDHHCFPHQHYYYYYWKQL